MRNDKEHDVTNRKHRRIHQVLDDDVTESDESERLIAVKALIKRRTPPAEILRISTEAGIR